MSDQEKAIVSGMILDSGATQWVDGIAVDTTIIDGSQTVYSGVASGTILSG